MGNGFLFYLKCAMWVAIAAMWIYIVFANLKINRNLQEIQNILKDRK